MAAHRFLAGDLSGTGQSKGGTKPRTSPTAPSEGQMNSPTRGGTYISYQALKRTSAVCNNRVYTGNCTVARGNGVYNRSTPKSP
ncbi:hypothetical protein SLEP1_g47117 [Rubroshorea leprosula]|uniref:Uncharacterized protein n=1 Tax=Rubroshorea leprosula TaxID=152421 RepID=A0AAV5LPG8_9ROSI|nr:hypothetical protein SLEP1_g47117 [Rubroshorea leprosula]